MLKNPEQLKLIIQAALLTAGKPMKIDQMLVLFAEDEKPSHDEIREALAAIDSGYQNCGVELKQVSSGYRLQVGEEMAPWINRMSEEKPSRYSRALLETIALIAYRQPITRAAVEDVRGVSVSTSIIRTLLEREWIKVVGHRDVPGKPALYGTTRGFLDTFNLKSLSELPPLAEMRSIEEIQDEFELKFSAAQQNDDETDAEDQVDSENLLEDEQSMESENIEQQSDQPSKKEELDDNLDESEEENNKLSVNNA